MDFLVLNLSAHKALMRFLCQFFLLTSKTLLMMLIRDLLED